MKRIACLFLALSCGSLTLPAAAQDWTVVPLGTTNDLHVVHYAGGGHAGAGYIAGNGGFLASTPDNVTWTTENSGTSADLFSLLQPSAGQVWLGGQAGTVRVGAFSTWNARNIPDAGQDYVLSTQSSLEAIAYGSGGSIWKSVNGGVDWTFMQSAGVPLHDGVGGTFVFGLAVGDNGTILKTTDSGLTWTPRPSGTTADLYGVSGGGTGQYFAVGEHGTILESHDNGETWAPRPSGTTRTLRALDASGQNGSWLLAVGDDGAVVKTTDSGGTWCRLETGRTNDFYDVGMPLNAVYFIVGQGGLFLQTTTGGGACSTVSEVEATLVPVNPPIVVPAGGGPIQYRATLQNTTSRSQSFDAWIDVVLPNGSVFGPIDGPRALTLAAGQSLGPITLAKNVPAAAPPGTYTVRLRVGRYPGSLVDEATFTFTKSASAPREGDGARAPMTPADWGAAASALTAAASTDVPAGYALSDVYPNPLAEAGTLTLTVEQAQHVTAAVYDVQGRRVASVFDGEAVTGEAIPLRLDARVLAPGVYVVRVRGETFAESRRLVVMR